MYFAELLEMCHNESNSDISVLAAENVFKCFPSVMREAVKHHLTNKQVLFFYKLWMIIPVTESSEYLTQYLGHDKPKAF